MAIARVFDGKGWTAAQYDALMVKLIDRLQLPAGRPARGVLFHWMAATDEGIRAVDVYDTRDAADRLAQDSIVPIATELGLPMPQITEYEVHNFLAA